MQTPSKEFGVVGLGRMGGNLALHAAEQGMHVVGYDVMAVSKKAWDAMRPAQQTQFQAAAEKAMDDYTAKYIGLEKDIVEFMKSQGKKVYAPDVNAFRAYAQKKYVDKYAQDWPKGALERINAL